MLLEMCGLCERVRLPKTREPSPKFPKLIQPNLEVFSILGSPESCGPMTSIGILGEVGQLYDVSRPARLAGGSTRPSSQTHRSTHYHLEKCSQHRQVVGGAGCNEKTRSRIRSSKCVIFSKLSGVEFLNPARKLVVEHDMEE
jgi:hypothetical protein